MPDSLIAGLIINNRSWKSKGGGRLLLTPWMLINRMHCV